MNRMCGLRVLWNLFEIHIKSSVAMQIIRFLLFDKKCGRNGFFDANPISFSNRQTALLFFPFQHAVFLWMFSHLNRIGFTFTNGMRDLRHWFVEQWYCIPCYSFHVFLRIFVPHFWVPVHTFCSPNTYVLWCFLQTSTNKLYHRKFEFSIVSKHHEQVHNAHFR